MRKLLLILLLIPFFAQSQVWQKNNLRFGHHYVGLRSDTAFILPILTAPLAYLDSGALRYNVADSSLYVWTGYQWRQIGAGSGGGSGTVTSFAFTNSTGITGTVTNATTTPTLSLVIDSGAIANFSAKVRSLISATYPIQYTSGTGVFNLDTSAGKWRSENYYNTIYLKNITGLITQGWNTKLSGSGTPATPYVISIDTTTQTLTDGATVTFDANAGVSAKVTLGGNRTLAFSNFRNGMFLSLLIIQDGTGGRTITLPASTRVINAGAGAVTLTTAASSHDILTFWKINDVIYCNYGKNYN